MFNVLISANETAWETDQLMRMDCSRFKEHSDGRESKIITLGNPDSLSLLEEVPSLLMYESGTTGANSNIVRYGFVRDILVTGDNLAFHFAEEARFSRSIVQEFSDLLGLNKYEHTRTHWAVKDGDIPNEMLKKFLPSSPSASESLLPRRVAPFISYAREDAETAKRLYRDLTLVGAEPWLDSEKLLGGQEWDTTIKDAAKNSTHFIALISQYSVNKQGYVQKELRHALEILDEFPPNHIFVIPVRLDPSSPLHERLRRLHQIDLFPDYHAGLQRILASLKIASAASSAPPLKAYEKVVGFARDRRGLGLHEDQAVRWGSKWLARHDFEDFAVFKRIVTFAKDPTGLALHPRAADNWAEDWFAQSLQTRFDEFIEAFSTATISLHMSPNQARNWAMARLKTEA